MPKGIPKKKKIDPVEQPAKEQSVPARGYGALPPNIILTKKVIDPVKPETWVPRLGKDTLSDDYAKTGVVHSYFFNIGNKRYGKFIYTEKNIDMTKELKVAAAKEFAAVK